MLGKDLAEIKDVDQSSKENSDLLPMKAATGNVPKLDDSKLPERGIHRLTHSVTDELSRPISEVDDDSGQTSKISARVSPPGPELRGAIRVPFLHRLELTDDGGFEGAEEEIDSDSDGHSTESQIKSYIACVNDRLRKGKEEDEEFEELSRGISFLEDRLRKGEEEPHSEELRTPISSLNEGLKREGDVGEEEEDGEVIQSSQELQDEPEHPNEPESHAPSGRQNLQQSDSDELSTNENDLDLNKTGSADGLIEDDVSNLGTSSTEPRGECEESAQQPRLDSEISLFYPQQVDPEDVINPFSLEVRIRKAREQQDLEWEAEKLADESQLAENLGGASQPHSSEEEAGCLTAPGLEEISPDERTGSWGRNFETSPPSQVRNRKVSEALAEEEPADEAKKPSKNKTGVGEAVLLGALASGVNVPTWFFIRAVLVGLVVSLLLLLHIAIKSDSLFVLLNVLFLIAIAGGLIILLSWYICEIGLVSVDKQMAELNINGEPSKEGLKTS